MKKRLLTGILLIVWGLASLIGLTGCAEAILPQNSEASSEIVSQSEEATVQENKEYYSVEEVALYLHLYGHLKKRRWQPDGSARRGISGK